MSKPDEVVLCPGITMKRLPDEPGIQHWSVTVGGLEIGRVQKARVGPWLALHGREQLGTAGDRVTAAEAILGHRLILMEQGVLCPCGERSSPLGNGLCQKCLDMCEDVQRRRQELRRD